MLICRDWSRFICVFCSFFYSLVVAATEIRWIWQSYFVVCAFFVLEHVALVTPGKLWKNHNHVAGNDYYYSSILSFTPHAWFSNIFRTMSILLFPQAYSSIDRWFIDIHRFIDSHWFIESMASVSSSIEALAHAISGSINPIVIRNKTRHPQKHNIFSAFTRPPYVFFVSTTSSTFRRTRRPSD